jgi:hypothetical protein
MITHFFMVCRTPRHPASQTKPEKRYATLAEAVTAAQALADQEGVPFTILQAVRCVQPRDTATPSLL